MAPGLGRAAYRALSRRGNADVKPPSGQRPDGELVWLHAPEAGSLLAVEDLALRLSNARQGLSVLLTLPDLSRIDPNGLPHDVFAHKLVIDQMPGEHPAAVKAFLDHWHPDVGIWCWGQLRPNLTEAALNAGIPLMLIDADSGGFDGRRDRWLPYAARSQLSRFHSVLARSPRGVARLRKLGLTDAQIELTPPLQAGGQALASDDSDVAALSSTLTGRPVWLAVAVQPEELSTVLSAHRAALRLSHRLLLILHPAQTGQIESILEKTAADGFRSRAWDYGHYPDDGVQILVAEDAQDLGLFYRVAPVTFLGSSLVPGRGGRDPFEAAALGSAILYGPNVRRYLPFYTRLANAGAARIVNDAGALGTAVTHLVAPDQAAAMAHAGWDVISEGAALTDRVIELVEDCLDLRRAALGGRDARP